MPKRLSPPLSAKNKSMFRSLDADVIVPFLHISISWTKPVNRASGWLYREDDVEGLDCVNCHPYTKQQLSAMVKGFVWGLRNRGHRIGLFSWSLLVRLGRPYLSTDPTHQE